MSKSRLYLNPDQYAHYICLFISHLLFTPLQPDLARRYTKIVLATVNNIIPQLFSNIIVFPQLQFTLLTTVPLLKPYLLLDSVNAHSMDIVLALYLLDSLLVFCRFIIFYLAIKCSSQGLVLGYLVGSLKKCNIQCNSHQLWIFMFKLIKITYNLKFSSST